MRFALPISLRHIIQYYLLYNLSCTLSTFTTLMLARVMFYTFILPSNYKLNILTTVNPELLFSLLIPFYLFNQMTAYTGSNLRQRNWLNEYKWEKQTKHSIQVMWPQLPYKRNARYTHAPPPHPLTQHYTCAFQHFSLSMGHNPLVFHLQSVGKTSIFLLSPYGTIVILLAI